MPQAPVFVAFQRLAWVLVDVWLWRAADADGQVAQLRRLAKLFPDGGG